MQQTNIPLPCVNFQLQDPSLHDLPQQERQLDCRRPCDIQSILASAKQNKWPQPMRCLLPGFQPLHSSSQGPRLSAVFLLLDPFDFDLSLNLTSDAAILHQQ